jgi:hypothetical protein
MQVAFVIFIFPWVLVPPARFLDQKSRQMGATWEIRRCADRRIPRDSQCVARYF